MIEPRTSDSATVPYYVPIFRHGPVEQNVVQEFGGLGRFEERARQPLPLVELVDDERFDDDDEEDDPLDFLHTFRELNRDVLVEVPYYLTEYDNEYAEPVEQILEGYDNVAKFFNDVDGVDVPVLSDEDTRPVSYGNYLSLYSQLSAEYDQAALRLFVTNRELTDDQRTALLHLSEMVPDRTPVLFDLVDEGGFESDGGVTSKLETLQGIFGSNLTFVLNAFEPYHEQTVNYGPDVAAEIGAAGFGDYVINRRVQRDIPIGNDGPNRIRHFFPTYREVQEYEGEDYDAAQTALTTDPDWDGDHCEFCRRADTGEGHHRFWKQIRMGHYIHSVLTAEDETLDDGAA